MISLEKTILFAIFIHVTSGCECVKICFNHIHYLFITYLFRTIIQKEDFIFFVIDQMYEIPIKDNHMKINRDKNNME